MNRDSVTLSRFVAETLAAYVKPDIAAARHPPGTDLYRCVTAREAARLT